MQIFFKIIAILYCLLAPFQLVLLGNLNNPTLFLKLEVSFFLSAISVELLIFTYNRFQAKASIYQLLNLLLSVSIFIAVLSYISQTGSMYSTWTIITYHFFRILKSFRKDLEPLNIIILTLLSYIQFTILDGINPVAMALSLMFSSFAYPLFFQDLKPNRFKNIIFVIPAILCNFLIGLNLLSLVFTQMSIPAIIFLNSKEFSDKSFRVYSSLIFIIMIIIAVLSFILKV